MCKEQLDSVSRNWFNNKKVQWLTKPMSITGSSATIKNLTKMYRKYSSSILTELASYRLLQQLYVRVWK